MELYYTDNPLRDFARYDSEQQEMLGKLPVCCECGEHIQQEDAVKLDDKYICDICLEGTLAALKGVSAYLKEHEIVYEVTEQKML